MPAGHYPAREWPQRFWAKVNKTESCWLWIGATDAYGYGVAKRNGAATGAHRIAFELAGGTIPPTATLDHLCRVRHCVNPAHLEPVSNVENVMRGISPPAVNARRTACKRGHPFPSERSSDGRRKCALCVPIYRQEQAALSRQ